MRFLVYDHFQGEQPLPNGLAPKYHQSFWQCDHNHYNVLTRFIPLPDTRLGFFHLMTQTSENPWGIKKPDQITEEGIHIFPVELNYADRSLVLENCFAHIRPQSLTLLRKGKMKLLIYYAYEAFEVEQAHWLPLLERSLGLLGIPGKNVILVFGCKNWRENVANYYVKNHSFWNWQCYNWVQFDHFEFEYSQYLHKVLDCPKKRQLEWVENVTPEKMAKKTFLFLNGAGRNHRVYLIKELKRRGLLEHALWSYLDKFRDDGGFDCFFPTFCLDKKQRRYFHGETQLKKKVLDTKESFNEWHNRGMSQWCYNQTWLSLISETLVSKKSHFITEKTFKPIANLHPFLIWGYQGILQDLKNAGYQTFSPWFNENYDKIPHHGNRVEKVIQEIKRLCTWSESHWREILKEMKPVLEHNRALLLSRNFSQRIEDLFDQIEARSTQPITSITEFNLSP